MTRRLSGARGVAAASSVFVSYDRRDWARFVRTLVARLREGRVKVWVDRGEIWPGDIIVDRVFRDGIGTADVVVAVVSPSSLVNPWCRLEWNAAVTRWLRGGCRLIVLRLDGAVVPTPLDGLAWVDVDPDGDWSAQLRQIRRTIRVSRP